MVRRLAALALAQGALFVVLVIGLAATSALDGSTLTVAALATAGGMAIGAGLLVVAQAPLRRLARSVDALAQRELDVRGPLAPDEISEAFSALLQRLEERLSALAQERDRLLAALDSSVNGVLLVDASGRISFANAAAERLFQHSREELVRHTFAWLLPEEQAIEALRVSREEGRAQTCVIEGPGRQYLELFSAPIIGGEGAALLVFHDVTEVKRSEQVRRDFVANVSHELRTPLASLKSVLETLQSGALEDREAARDFLARAEAEADRLVQMVEELLELSRIESGAVPLAREPVAVEAVLREAVERMRPQALRGQVALTLETEERLPPVLGDAERLERAAVNLIHNAIKFTPAGGTVRVSAAREHDAVVVRVRDTGRGIEPEELPRIFERFYKTDKAREGGGTGLGLAVVKHTIEAHGGTVGVESAPGRGATFSFKLPLTLDETK